MRIERTGLSAGWRRLLQALIAVLGIVVIVGSGGGAGFPDIDFGGPFEIAPSATVEPARAMVQVGTTQTFTVSAVFATPPLAYQWRRNGVDLVGATGASYTLVGANLGDDGAQFDVVVSAANGLAFARGLLRVSSAPGVVYQDGDFALSGWAVTAVVEPAANGPSYSASREAAGGNPDGFRSIAYQMPQGPSSARLFHTALSSTYDPAVQGAIYALDLGLDCKRLATTTNSGILLLPMFEQDGRCYAPQQWDATCAPLWQARRAAAWLADEFALIAGPACAAAEACPDFSVSAAPLHFGFFSSASLSADAGAGSVTQGIDNWKVTVWRR